MGEGRVGGNPTSRTTLKGKVYKIKREQTGGPK
jgi:hypothetical protein